MRFPCGSVFFPFFFISNCGKRIFSLWWTYGKVLCFCNRLWSSMDSAHWCVLWCPQTTATTMRGRVPVQALWTRTLLQATEVPVPGSFCLGRCSLSYGEHSRERVLFIFSSLPHTAQCPAQQSWTQLNWRRPAESLPYRNHCLWEMSGFWCLWKVWSRWVVLWKPTLILGGSNREWLAVCVWTASFCLDLVGAVGSSFLEGQVWRLISTDNRKGLESSRRPISGCDLWGHFQRDLTGMGRSTKKVGSTVTGAGVLDWIKWRNCPSTCIHLSGSDCIHCDHRPHALTAMMDSTLKWWEKVNPWLP